MDNPIKFRRRALAAVCHGAAVSDSNTGAQEGTGPVAVPAFVWTCPGLAGALLLALYTCVK